MIVNAVNDIYKQAHQGSVAAIIQILNDKLSESGVRTRAIFANGVLQLLCEAATPDQLDRATLTERIRKILESISPRNIRRVNINSRIVREQQLLWFEEINRDPDGQLLWAEEISLRRPNFVKGMIEDWRETFSERDDIPKTLSPQAVREKRQFTKGILGGVVISAAVLAAGWGVYAWNQGKLFAGEQNQTQATAQPQWKETIKQDGDSFATAVRVAERAAKSGREAKTPTQWQEVADMWGTASRLMSEVPNSHPRADVAKNRMAAYRKNQEIALKNVK
ncbi:hypothetical protein [Leptolyngbya sp. NIES-2104]|uniref:hypothetical protein n=1 Tax=Leptolyngbya sp. NIES-2104 TaxID=1552121 RepID=UPI0006EC96E1|nr:hypothetical protein [Leptolyngbya sp. NIES-2104]GAP98513.1 hypothetical protein NIES2104_50680 [Leptolyngbya sp. NIES-2104]